jgi:hypothetical protein
MVGSMMFALPAVEAAAASTTVTTAQDIIIQPARNRRGRWNNRRFAPRRVVTSTRTTWVNGVRYRETIRTTYFANGRTRTVVVNRVRLGGRRGYIRNY